MKKFISLLVCAALIICCLTPAFGEIKAGSGSLLLATVSDIHYYPKTLATYKGEEFNTYLKGSNAVFEDMDGILDSTLAALENDAKEKGLKYVVVSGDLTTNGEYYGHTELAKKLAAFEKQTGIDVFVINGNHDINNSNASEFTSPDLKKEEAKITTPNDFYNIYKDLGYDKATAAFADNIDAATKNQTPGALSYSVSVDGYRLILADGGKYSAKVTKSGEDEHETAGCITEELLQWIISQADAAKKKGETPILFTHWNLSEMNYMHGELLQGFVIDEAYKLQETLADAGIHYAFSGHQHVSDIDVTYSDSGEPLYSCITPTLTQYPFAYRETEFKKDAGGTVTASYKQYSCDSFQKVKNIYGEEYDQPYYITAGCKKQLGGNLDASVYLVNMLKNILSDYITEIQETGSIIEFIENEFGFSVKEFLEQYISFDLKIDDTSVFSLDSVMRFVEDLDTQIYEQFILNPDKLWTAVHSSLQKLLEVKISDVPCTKYLETYGFGNPEKGGTLGDLFFSVLVTMYPGNEDISDDAFVQDVLKKCGTVEFVDLIFDSAIEYIVKDFVFDTVLDGIDVRLDTVLPQNTGVTVFFRAMYLGAISIFNSGITKAESTEEFAAALNKIVSLLSKGDGASYKILIETILSSGLIEYGTNINELADYILGMYFGNAEKKATAYQLQILADGIFNDPDKDWDVQYVYSGPVKVTPTLEDMQLPSEVTMTLGVDPSTSININWLTKYSVTGTDIEIVKANSKFSGQKTVKGVKAVSTPTTITGYGFDFGSFGILPWEKDAVKHTVTVSGLEPATTYKYTIGDFEKGFVTEGSFTTAGTNNKFAFAFISDAAGTTPDMYNNFVNTLKAVENNDVSFIINGGNTVVKGDNEDQWGYALNSARDYLLATPMQITTGTGETGDTYPVQKHFAVNNIPAYCEQMLGVYYSFDYENVHFTVLNTNELDGDGSLSAAQYAWLANDLESTNSLLKVLILNQSITGVNVLPQNAKTQLLEIINTYDVKLVLGAGDSVYTRTNFVSNNVAITQNKDIAIKKINGKSYTSYINTAGFVAINGCFTGSEFTDICPADKIYKTALDTKKPVYTIVNVEGNSIGVCVYALNADGSSKLIDSFGIVVKSNTATMGDIDFDGSISAADARLALRAAVGLENLSATQKLRADVDFNKRLDAADARLILRASVGLEKIIPGTIEYDDSDLAAIKF